MNARIRPLAGIMDELLAARFANPVDVEQGGAKDALVVPIHVGV